MLVAGYWILVKNQRPCLSIIWLFVG